MANHAAAQPHGEIAEVFPDVFVVRGTFRAGPGVHFDRNMTIVRTAGELVVLNSVRLNEAGEAALAKLGTVKHVIRLGQGHGLDDPYYVDRFGATLWGAPRMQHAGGRTLTDGDKPLAAEVFDFGAGARAEAAVILDLDGGVLVTCDAYQNWTTFEHCSWIARRVVGFMGFGPAVIGGPWAKKQGPAVRADFDRLVERPFRHLLSAHGTPLRDEARTRLPDAIRKRFG